SRHTRTSIRPRGRCCCRFCSAASRAWRSSSSCSGARSSPSSAAAGTRTMPPATPDPGSYRDREGRVFESDGRLLRALSARALEEWDAVSATPFFARAMADGRVVETRRVDLPADAPVATAQPWVAALEHQRIPFISYPYEWSFGMLRDAALLQLELLR